MHMRCSSITVALEYLPATFSVFGARAMWAAQAVVSNAATRSDRLSKPCVRVLCRR